MAVHLALNKVQATGVYQKVICIKLLLELLKHFVISQIK